MPDVRLTDPAQDEYDDAVRQMARRSADSARRLEAEVRGILAELAVNPMRFGEIDARDREAILIGFLYRVIYQVERDGSVTIVAVAHTSRDPDYWRRR